MINYSRPNKLLTLNSKRNIGTYKGNALIKTMNSFMYFVSNKVVKYSNAKQLPTML